MASACLGFSLYERDWISCVTGGTLISKGRKEHAPQSSLDEEKKNACSVSVALRASIALGFQPGASSVPELKRKDSH